ncbi:proteasome assembly chaperone 3 [Citrus sinensis]|uniref:Proteasome assembly chaperone 3 n=1 Tax=Citrus sinensis TaxID=2711 RepID=A0ACB8MY03_CITSI|nr:proteasome assembly chaperone 3 [Citrus sinensis]
MSVLEQNFPVVQKKLSVDLKGNKTDIIICSYDDHFLVIATQIGTMGTILHARKDADISVHPTFSVSVIFGKRDEPMLVACARQLIEHISLLVCSSSGTSQPLVLSLGLKDHSAETLKGIVSAVTENRLW